MKVATWNVNGIRARSSQVSHWIDGEEPDVICLQEIKAGVEQIPEPLASLAGYHACWHGSGGYSGVALLLRSARFPKVPKFEHPTFDHEFRIVVTHVDDVVFGSMYGPNGGKDYAAKITFLEGLEVWCGELERAGKRLVLCGDYNVARAPIDVHPMLRKAMIGQSSEERTLIDRVFSHGLVDVGRYVDPDNDRLFTWWAPWRNLRQRNIGWRLDYIAAHHSLVDASVACKSYREVGTSDHAPVIAHLLEP
ncbi:MAG TPA: exodeoxyribonuclease III [Kofleriaceae bacterium]|nr:exodeoxyribonuclease III [Kofleriaceae bacterium]